ncbi:MAG TPA: RrF2 family transcriptional regulator [Candidatus Fusicatenibacter intestinigallinarum]|uniref:RrF2 family transcriptional regulator n=1 Tax=Candidatus Fusicatenibacter intestinigallinarum TaxID=2838598 RepID=A0A9D2SMP1_9FIRM|nr:RrF2 family transcriptional regulator [Candidatus Fusicatenibacter intestinigallinarum]
MKISTKGRYALRMMVDIAQQGRECPVALREIAQRQGISVKYLEQIAAVLTRAGYLKSVRGAQGGYILTREPKEYTAGEILRLTEGNLAPVECLEAEKNLCPRAEHCTTLRLWEELNQAVRQVVDGRTLEDLADEKRM